MLTLLRHNLLKIICKKRRETFLLTLLDSKQNGGIRIFQPFFPQLIFLFYSLIWGFDSWLYPIAFLALSQWLSLSFKAYPARLWFGLGPFFCQLQRPNGMGFSL